MLQKITDDMLEELHDGKHRIKEALNYKSEYPDIARREYEIAAQELTHAEKDHTSALELITEYRKEKGEPPEYMLTFWHERHDHYMEKYAKLKYLIDMFTKS
jgi:hypothetical protein